MLLSGLKLMMLGMLFVFLFLILMWLVIRIFSSSLREYALREEKQILKSQSKNNISKKTIPVAAILGALKLYRKF